MTTAARRAAPGLGARVGYLLAGLPIAIVAFVVAVAGFSLGVSTLVIWVGVPVLAATLWAARGLALLERRGTERVTGQALPPHHYRVERPSARLAMLRDPQAWRDLLHAVLGFPVRLSAAVLTLVWGVVGLGGLLFGAWEWALPDDRRGLGWLLTGQSSRPLERDLHDGPQQRLVRMTMDLEASSRRLDDDPAAARPLVAGALAQSREALAELRALSRGIAPPILADRGLEAALGASAARSPVPVTLAVDVSDRLPPAIENAAYHVVTEALTNVAKHAAAGRAAVAVEVSGTSLVVEVTDDGRGGAHVGKGHGLAGLADRVTAVEGTFDLRSPDGGPTVVRVVLPVGSA